MLLLQNICLVVVKDKVKTFTSNIGKILQFTVVGNVVLQSKSNHLFQGSKKATTKKPENFQLNMN